MYVQGHYNNYTSQPYGKNSLNICVKQVKLFVYSASQLFFYMAWYVYAHINHTHF